jgi:Mce-associated membrane protein
MSTPETPDVTPAAAPSSGRHRAAKPGTVSKAHKPPKVRKPPKARKPAKARKSSKGPAVTASVDVSTDGVKAPETVVPAAYAPPRPSRLRPLVFPTLAVVTLAALIAAAILQFSGGSKKQLAPFNNDTKAALAEANHTVKDILSYDYRQLDSGINTAKGEVTGQLLSDYTSTAKKLLTQAGPIKAIVTATVSAQSIVQAQSGRVAVLMYVDQESVKQLAGAKTPTTRIDPLRVQMTMTKVKGHWMASDLEPV